MDDLLIALLLLAIFAVVFVMPLVGALTGTTALAWLWALTRRIGRLEKLLAEGGVAAPAVRVTPTPVRTAPPLGELPPIGGGLVDESPTEESPIDEVPMDEPPTEEALTEEAAVPAVSSTPRPARKRPAGPKKPTPSLIPPEWEAWLDLSTWTIPSAERVAVWLASVVGGLFVVLASLFALVVAIDRGWLIPSVRVSLGLVSGIGLWISAMVFRRWGHRLLVSALSGAGIGVLYGSLFAAAGLYDLLPDMVAGALMCGVTAVAMVSAVRLRDRFMAHLGLVGGLLTPILVSSGENNPVGLFSYLTLLAAGTLIAAWHRRWADPIAVAIVGIIGLYAMWTVNWYRPDQVPVAVVFAGVLSLPFAVAAGWRGESRPVAEVTAWLGAIALPLLALPWVVPVDPVFYDPHSGLELVRALGSAQWWGLGAVALLTAPAFVAARVRGRWLATLGVSLTAALLVIAFVGGWSVLPEPRPWLLVAGLLAPLAVVVTLHLGGREVGLGLLPLMPAFGLVVAPLVVAVDLPGPAVLAVLAAVPLAGVMLGIGTRSGLLLLATLLGTALPLLVAGIEVAELGVRWVAAPTVLAYALFATVPLLDRTAQHRSVRWITAALAGPVLFWPLYACWKLELGDAVVGVLPVALGAMALLAAGVLMRVHRVDRNSGVLALFVGVALLGVSAAIPVQLQEEWLTVAWGLEAAALAALSRQLRHPLVRWTAVLLGVTVAVRLLLNPWALSYGDTAGMPVLNWTLYTWGVPALCLLASGPLLRRKGTTGWMGTFDAFVSHLLTVLGILVGFALINVQVSHGFQDAGPVELGGSGLLQGMVRSLSWAAYGVIVLIAGLADNRRPMRLLGFALVMLAAGKVFAVDLWALSGFVRVGSVLGLGVCLLLAAFLFERLVLRTTADPPAPVESP